MAKVRYFGRLEHDVDPDEVRDSIAQAITLLAEMQAIMERNLSHEEALNALHELHDQPDVLLAMPLLRPIFLSHLIGRLLDDGVTQTAIAEKLGVSRQLVYRWHYNGAGGRATEVPRTRRKSAVVNGAK